MGSHSTSTAVDTKGEPSTLTTSGQAQTRVVILGGGFGGVYTARHLTQLLGRRKDIHIELLSEENYFVFQPLLPEVAAGSINANHVVNPIREMAPKAQFRWCKVSAVDVQRKIVWVIQGQTQRLVGVPYDHLVFALGKVTDHSRMPGVSSHALAMKNVEDAFKLRNHVFRCLEQADIEQNSAERSALLTFVVAGGGFSGVETIGELSELLHKVIKFFKNIHRSDLKLILVHSRDTLLGEMHPSLGKAAGKMLERRGVTLRLKERTRAATRHAVYLQNGEAIPTRTFICTVGNAPNPICQRLIDREIFAEASIGNRPLGIFKTDLHMQCIGAQSYWAVGDCAGIPMPDREGELCPATAQFAIRQAKICAQNILASIDPRNFKKSTFKFKGLGTLASLGSREAVADMMGVRFTGFFAWIAWRTIYLSKLPGMLRRFRVALDWTIDLFFRRDITQMQPDEDPQLRLEHYEAGEIITGVNDISRQLYVIQSGEVRIQRRNGEYITTLSKGEVFGEKALLIDSPRTANVIANCACDVLVMTRSGFTHLVSQFSPLEQYFDTLIRSRYPELVDEAIGIQDLVAEAVHTLARQGGDEALLKVGESLPQINGLETENTPRLIYFFPKSGSFGCTAEACSLRDSWSIFSDEKIQVFGVSLDDSASQSRFKEKHQLPFHFISDSTGEYCKLFGVGITDGVADRVSFLFDSSGTLIKVWPDVDPFEHAQEVLSALQISVNDQ